MSGVYVPDDGPPKPRGLGERPGSNRRAILEFFKSTRDTAPPHKSHPSSDDTKRLMYVDETSSELVPSDYTAAGTSTGNGYWQRFTEATRKKSWYSTASSGAATLT